MPVITAGLYQVILEQDYRGQTVLNSFFFEENLGSDDEQELCAQAFDEDLLIALAPIQHTSVVYISIRAKNVTGDLADFVRTPTTSAGTLVGLPLSSFIAAGIRLNRTTKETRNGQKRFCGATEEAMAVQSWDPTYLTVLETLGLALVAPITTVGGIFNPVIARQDPIIPTNWTTNPVQSHTVRSTVTSQVSRKAGSGI